MEIMRFDCTLYINQPNQDQNYSDSWYKKKKKKKKNSGSIESILVSGKLRSTSVFRDGDGEVCCPANCIGVIYSLKKTKTDFCSFNCSMFPKKTTFIGFI